MFPSTPENAPKGSITGEVFELVKGVFGRSTDCVKKLVPTSLKVALPPILSLCCARACSLPAHDLRRASQMRSPKSKEFVFSAVGVLPAATAQEFSQVVRLHLKLSVSMVVNWLNVAKDA